MAARSNFYEPGPQEPIDLFLAIEREDPILGFQSDATIAACIFANCNWALYGPTSGHQLTHLCPQNEQEQQDLEIRLHTLALLQGD